ncbi:MAG TPA: DUF1232 domain-containing protein [Acidimicrobiia bacterium]|nr:DUF1232 domain-containing protein [Acidimicrobiia bacterium]
MTDRASWRIALETVLPAAKLLFRLAKDPRVPPRTRLLAVGALAYVAVPFDLIPDSIPILGKIDDFGLVAVALVRLVRDAGPELVGEHWDGDAAELDAFLGAIDLLDSLIPERVRRMAAVVDRR